MRISKLRITLEAHSYPELNEAFSLIRNEMFTRGQVVTGLTALPTKTRRYCVLRSPHGNKNSGEHFERRVHKRLLEITSPTEENLANVILALGVSAGVFVKVKAL